MVTIQHRRNTSVQWSLLNPILAPGEKGFEIDTGKFKMGDGDTRWNELDYFIPESEVRSLINEAVTSTGTPDGREPTTPDNLLDHILSLNPHPVYDDGPSLLLLYQNGKV